MYELAPYQLDVLETACVAADRLEEARQAIAQDGLIVGHASLNGPRAHPAVAIERDSRVALLRSLRELALSPEDVAEAPRPAQIANRYHRTGA
jgi:phage terminase small subunit